MIINLNYLSKKIFSYIIICHSESNHHSLQHTDKDKCIHNKDIHNKYMEEREDAPNAAEEANAVDKLKAEDAPNAVDKLKDAEEANVEDVVKADVK